LHHWATFFQVVFDIDKIRSNVLFQQKLIAYYPEKTVGSLDSGSVPIMSEAVLPLCSEKGTLTWFQYHVKLKISRNT